MGLQELIFALPGLQSIPRKRGGIQHLPLPLQNTAVPIPTQDLGRAGDELKGSSAGKTGKALTKPPVHHSMPQWAEEPGQETQMLNNPWNPVLHNILHAARSPSRLSPCSRSSTNHLRAGKSQVKQLGRWLALPAQPENSPRTAKISVGAGSKERLGSPRIWVPSQASTEHSGGTWPCQGTSLTHNLCSQLAKFPSVLGDYQ